MSLPRFHPCSQTVFVCALDAAVSGGSRLGRRVVFAPSSAAALAAMCAALLGGCLCRRYCFPGHSESTYKYNHTINKSQIFRRVRLWENSEEIWFFRYFLRYDTAVAASSTARMPSTSSISYQPMRLTINSAAVSAPSTNARRVKDSCVSEIRS